MRIRRPELLVAPRLRGTVIVIFAVALASGGLLACKKKATPTKPAATASASGTTATAPVTKPPARKPPPAPKLAPAPKTERQDIVETIHGRKVADPYRWLEKGKDPKVKAWARAQDRRARAYLNALPGRDAITSRLAQLRYIDWVSPPRRRGNNYFFKRRHKDKEKVVYYWRAGRKGPARVLFDPNQWSKDGSVSLKGVFPDHQGRRVAFKKSENNADAATLYVKEVATGKVSKKDVIRGAKYAEPSWTADGSGFYYTRLPVDPKIPVDKLPGYAAVYFHKLGDDPKNDRLIHAKLGDPRKFLAAEISRDGRFLFFHVWHGWTRSDVSYRDLKKEPLPAKGPVTFRALAVGKKAKYEVYAYRGKIYVRTDEGAPRYRLFQIDPERIARKDWKEIVPERKDAVLKSFDVVGGHLALQYLRRATTRIEVATLAGKVVNRVSFPGLGSASQLTGHPDDDVAYYSFTSFTRPKTIYQTSVRFGGRKLYYQVKVPIDPNAYVTKQVFFRSKDGTKVSMFVVRPRKFVFDRSAPTLLYGYGGFNHSVTPLFSAFFYTWLEQGGIVAIPNLRGGGEYGEEWHHAAMTTHKQKTFDDFLAAARYLIRRRYTTSDKLAIRGGSNGGLLVGAAMTQRPDLFRAVSCLVPLLDMVRYHLFGSGRTWISEYGSADDPKQFAAILAYSPYHRVKEGTPYPSLLMLSADSDDRVDPMHARKFVAAIQYSTTSKHPVLLRVETKSGHGGGDLVKKRIAREADELAFLMHELGMQPRQL